MVCSFSVSLCLSVCLSLYIHTYTPLLWGDILAVLVCGILSVKFSELNIFRLFTQDKCDVLYETSKHRYYFSAHAAVKSSLLSLRGSIETHKWIQKNLNSAHIGQIQSCLFSAAQSCLCYLSNLVVKLQGKLKWLL